MINYALAVEYNLQGKELEKQGKIDEAIILYERNVANGFDGSHPYKRLSIIYRKLKRYDDEIRVLNAAIKIYEPKQDVDKDKYDYFVTRLEQAKKLR